ncbi:hypothetical protein [Clostridium sp. AF37-7]|uniref:hypothetical protein n=1 Tax=Clostridium sp. AF37-7 TaxID=2293017 RepID=UPI001FAA4FFE
MCGTYFAVSPFLHGLDHQGKRGGGLPGVLIISDTSDDDYVNFRKGVDQAAVEYNVDVSFITLYEKDNLAQQMELVRREAADGAGVVILEPVDELECRQYLEENTYGTPIILLGELSPDEEVKGAVHMDWTAAGRKLGEAITAEQSPIFLSGSLQITHISARRGR